MSGAQEPIEPDPTVVGDGVDDIADAAASDATDSVDGDRQVHPQDLRKSTSSIASSILEYRQIRGRTYQTSKTTEYWAPNDETHIEGFDVAHQWITMMLGDQLYVPPIGDNPQHILDVGTGTGIWAIDVADKFPSAEVIGSDISPTQPSWVPPNLSFQIDDAQLEWTFKPDHFDFIHVRYMHGAIDDWPKLYRQIYKHLKPGGWFQHMEPDIELKCENPAAKEAKEIFGKWAKLFYDVGDKTGRTFRLTDGIMEQSAESAGFENITRKVFKIPLGPWPKDKKLKEQGMYCGWYMDLSMEGFAILPIGEIMGWSNDEVFMLCAQMRSAIRNSKNMGAGHMYVSPG